MRARFSSALFLTGFVAGLFQVLHPAGIGFGRGFEMAVIARNLAEHGVYGNPFEPAITGPTAMVPPLYVLFLAALIKLTGSLQAMALAAIGINIVVNALIAALMPELSQVFFGDWRPGAFAGALWICSMRLMPQWDVSFTITGSVLFCLLAARTIRPGARSAWWAVAAGAIGGLVSLMNPATVLVLLPWAAFLLLWRRAPLGYAIRYGGILLLAIAACNAPWALRNYRIWHAPVLRTNFGMTLHSANNDCAESSLDENMLRGCHQATYPLAGTAEIQLLQKLGEVEYDRARTAEGWQWIHAHRARFWELTRRRIFEFWFPTLSVFPYATYVIWLITVLSVPGILWMARRREPATLFLLAVWLLFPLVYYLPASEDRYRYPILWTSALPAGYCLAALMRRCKRASGYPAKSSVTHTMG
jgi:hypothetical protein